MSLENTIEKFIKQEIMLGGGPEKIDPSESLIDTGILDSLGLLRLIAFVEEAFGVEIEDEEVLPANFQSVEAIKQFLSSKGLQESG